MQPTDLEDLERLVDRELKALPGPRAPRTLLPNVMAAIDVAARRRWYARAWRTWPLVVQAGSIAAALLIVAAVLIWLPSLDLHRAPVWWHSASGVATAILHDALAIRTIARVVWDLLLEPVFISALILLFVLCAVGAGLATILKHSAVQRVLHS